jgi:hypothetical protein
MKSKHQVLTVKKPVLDLNILLIKPSHTLQRRPGYKVLGFKFKMFTVSIKEIQHVNVNSLQGYKECVTTGSISGICCVLGGFCFIYWPIGLLTVLQVLSTQE